MKRKGSRRRNREERHFLLPQIVSMRPYIVRLMADLRAQRIRQVCLKRRAAKTAGSDQETYVQRRRRHEADLEFDDARSEERLLLREFRKLGVRVGDVVRGEMLFPCRVDNQRAYFVWYDGERRPTLWRYHGDMDLKPIPEGWFTQFAPEKERTASHRNL